jgi:Flp pilus assembly protein TadG
MSAPEAMRMTHRRFSLKNVRLPRCLARFGANERGATAVEFALIALPFFGLLFAIMHTSIVMFANQALQSMTSSAARQIMTGEITTASGIAAFRSALCVEPYDLMFDCDKVLVQVESFGTSFATANPSTFVNNDCFNADEAPTADCWDAGGPRSVVVVRIAYDWPFSINLEDLNNKTTLVAVSAFRNEPF